MKSLPSLFCLLLVFFSCSQKETKTSPIVARVNGADLTLDNYRTLRQHYADPFMSPDHIVSQWVQSELLYQAALSKDFHKDKSLVNSVNEYRRKLLGDMYLEAMIKEAKPISNADIKRYYEQNKSSFVRLVDEARIYHFVAPTENEARNIVRALKRKKSGGELRTIFLDYNVDADIIKKGFLLPELDELIFLSTSEAVLDPKEIDGKYHIIEILEKFPANSIISLDEAYDEVYQRLIQRQIILSSKTLLDSLYNSNDIETFLETINE